LRSCLLFQPPVQGGRNIYSCANGFLLHNIKYPMYAINMEEREAMKKRKISNKKMALLLKTSRTQVDRLLDAKNGITLSSQQRAAAIVGCRVAPELV